MKDKLIKLFKVLTIDQLEKVFMNYMQFKQANTVNPRNKDNNNTYLVSKGYRTDNKILCEYYTNNILSADLSIVYTYNTLLIHKNNTVVAAIINKRLDRTFVNEELMNYIVEEHCLFFNELFKLVEED